MRLDFHFGTPPFSVGKTCEAQGRAMALDKYVELKYGTFA
jgi:hypothetical protein